MFIIRYPWIIVFLAVSSLLTGFQMVECKPVATSFSQSGILTTASPRFTNPARTRSITSATAEDDYDEENRIETRRNKEPDLTPVTIRIYKLYNRCSHGNIFFKGKLNQVYALGNDDTSYAQITARDVRPGEIELRNEVSGRYLCFNRQGKLIMRRKFEDSSCVFREGVQRGWVTMQSVYNATWYVGFQNNGRSLHGAAWRKPAPPTTKLCYGFMKTGERVYQSLGDINHSRKGEDQQQISGVLAKIRSTSRKPARTTKRV